MPDYLTPEQFMILRQTGLPVLDVRSPTEYAAGHIPGSFNTPALTDAERAAVGKVYAKHGQAAAFSLAKELTLPHQAARLAKIQHLVSAQANQAQEVNKVLLHCWRGGQRSHAAACLLERCGFRPMLLQGGYKAYRAKVRADLATMRQVLVLGGYAGSGKTAILRELARQGQQIIDLEALAGHRGSAFGGIGLPEQITGEDMENNLRDAWMALDPLRPVWLEDEDRRIGKISLCSEFFQHIEQGRLIWLEVPREWRIRNLMEGYAKNGVNKAIIHEFCRAIERLQKKLGTQKAALAKQAILANDMEKAVSLVLDYYDKAYLKQKARRTTLINQNNHINLDLTLACNEIGNGRGKGKECPTGYFAKTGFAPGQLAEYAAHLLVSFPGLA